MTERFRAGMDLSERQFDKIAGMIASCDSKKRYAKRSTAEIAASHHDRPMRSYRCLICGEWHLTSRPER